MSSPFPDRRHRKRPKKRHLPWVLLGLVLALLLSLGVLAVLRPWEEATDTAQSAPLGALDAVSVSGRAGATPVISLTRPLTVGALKFRVLENGEGRDITSGSPVLLSLSSFDGASGASKSPRGRPRLVVGHAHPEALGVDLASLVIGQKEGARIVTIRPLGSQADGTTPSEITVIDILASSAYGDENTGEHAGPLQVEMTADGPLVTHDASVPRGTSVQTLIRGDGPQVREHDRVVAQYAVIGWSDSLVRSSTWLDGMPQLVPLDSTMKGLSEALVDRRVGSRLAITVPPDLATGDDTLCIVIDILGTEPAGEDEPEAEDESAR
ncbi:peptidylprolyl isomerase [Schaalia cardiffensis]|uniref:FKBP-type peptidyl-prolyl cis-trans isomerase n=1 Tax=Schaalia cardiffensis TaxID=181487 RepID=UPI002AAF3880|nr:peptidylprolyl isomerase [Schaalia cardiffensis]